MDNSILRCNFHLNEIHYRTISWGCTILASFSVFEPVFFLLSTFLFFLNLTASLPFLLFLGGCFFWWCPPCRRDISYWNKNVLKSLGCKNLSWLKPRLGLIRSIKSWSDNVNWLPALSSNQMLPLWFPQIFEMDNNIAVPTAVTTNKTIRPIRKGQNNLSA